MAYHTRAYTGRAKAPSEPTKAYKPPAKEWRSQFSTDEELEIAQAVVDELKASDKTLHDCMTRLVLANVTGYKMDVVTDLAAKFPRYGSFTPKQRDYAISIVTEHHLPKLLELLAGEAETGATAVEDVPEAELTAREKERLAAQERVAAKREAYREKQVEIARLSEAVADYETESNITYGMF